MEGLNTHNTPSMRFGTVLDVVIVTIGGCCLLIGTHTDNGRTDQNQRRTQTIGGQVLKL